jgi:hypothetical protein
MRTVRRACTRSCAPTTTTRAPTGPATGPIRPLPGLDGRGPGQDADLLRDGRGRDDAATVPHTCRRRPDRRLPLAARRRAWRSTVAEYARTGFQGGLQWYRCGTTRTAQAELQLIAGRAIDRAALLHRRRSDWGVYQRPGALQRMQAGACADLRGCHLLPAPATGCSRNSPKPSTACCWGFWSAGAPPERRRGSWQLRSSAAGPPRVRKCAAFQRTGRPTTGRSSQTIVVPSGVPHVSSESAFLRQRRHLLGLAAAGLAAPFSTALAQDSGGYRFSPVNQYGISLTAAYWNPIIGLGFRAQRREARS